MYSFSNSEDVFPTFTPNIYHVAMSLPPYHKVCAHSQILLSGFGGPPRYWMATSIKFFPFFYRKIGGFDGFPGPPKDFLGTTKVLNKEQHQIFSAVFVEKLVDLVDLVDHQSIVWWNTSNFFPLFLSKNWWIWWIWWTTKGFLVDH